MYVDVIGPGGVDHEMMACLPDGPGRQLRLIVWRGRADPDFTERERAILTLLRPHLHAVHLQVLRHQRGIPELTNRQWELLRLVEAGLGNTQIARRLHLAESTVRNTWRTPSAGSMCPVEQPLLPQLSPNEPTRCPSREHRRCRPSDTRRRPRAPHPGRLHAQPLRCRRRAGRHGAPKHRLACFAWHLCPERIRRRSRRGLTTASTARTSRVSRS